MDRRSVEEWDLGLVRRGLVGSEYPTENDRSLVGRSSIYEIDLPTGRAYK